MQFFVRTLPATPPPGGAPPGPALLGLGGPLRGGGGTRKTSVNSQVGSSVAAPAASVPGSPGTRKPGDVSTPGRGVKSVGIAEPHTSSHGKVSAPNNSNSNSNSNTTPNHSSAASQQTSPLQSRLKGGGSGGGASVSNTPRTQLPKIMTPNTRGAQ
eukprot:GDKI01000932.1.p1 GENE.GDKI01000932.1~~GDKI01000932.1.p1  ORF type:complete len:156 (-),score=25.30 GDKI01000932.1:31-498(-)